MREREEGSKPCGHTLRGPSILSQGQMKRHHLGGFSIHFDR